MSLPFRRRSRPRGAARLALAGDFPDTGESVTEVLDRVRPADYDGTTVIFGGASDAGQPEAGNPPGSGYFSGIGSATTWHPGQYPPDPGPAAEPPARLRAQPRYQPPQQPPPAGYAATTGPMPAVGRLAPAIGDALTRDPHWGPMLTPQPCGHCGTPPPVPDGILERTKILGYVNWLAGQAGWKYDVDIILTCPPCQARDAWKARQGQLEVQGPDSGWYCYRHDAGDPDAWCDCPGAGLATDVMLTSHDYLRTGRAISIQILRDTQAGAR
jgi:hypothetical protein